MNGHSGIKVLHNGEAWVHTKGASTMQRDHLNRDFNIERLVKVVRTVGFYAEVPCISRSKHRPMVRERVDCNQLFGPTHYTGNGPGLGGTTHKQGDGRI